MGMLHSTDHFFSVSLSIYNRLYCECIQNNNIARTDLNSHYNFFFSLPFLSTISKAIIKVHVKCYCAILSIQAISIRLYSAGTVLKSISNHRMSLSSSSSNSGPPHLTPESKKPKYTSTDEENPKPKDGTQQIWASSSVCHTA